MLPPAAPSHRLPLPEPARCGPGRPRRRGAKVGSAGPAALAWAWGGKPRGGRGFPLGRSAPRVVPRLSAEEPGAGAGGGAVAGGPRPRRALRVGSGEAAGRACPGGRRSPLSCAPTLRWPLAGGGGMRPGLGALLLSAARPRGEEFSRRLFKEPLLLLCDGFHPRNKSPVLGDGKRRVCPFRCF